MGKSVILNELDDTYVVTVIQYSNKGIIFILTDKITKKEVDRFIWEYPIGAYCYQGNLRRFRRGGDML